MKIRYVVLIVEKLMVMQLKDVNVDLTLIEKEKNKPN